MNGGIGVRVWIGRNRQGAVRIGARWPHANVPTQLGVSPTMSARRPSVIPSARLLIALPLVALVLVVGALAAFRWGDAVSARWADLQAAREGADIARTLHTTEDLLAWIADHPEYAALYSDTLVLHADTLRPTIGASPLTLSYAARRHVSGGRLDTSARVDARLVERLGLDRKLNADSVSVGTLIARTDLGDAAAHDALLSLLKMRGLPSTFPPLPPAQPQTGLYLTWRNHTFETPPDTLALMYAAMSPEQVDAQIATMQSGWLHDSAFRQAEKRWRADQPLLSHRTYRALASGTLTRTSARELAAALSSGDARWFSEPGFVLAAAHCSGTPTVVVLSDLPLGLWRALDESRLPMALARRGCSAS